MTSHEHRVSFAIWNRSMKSSNAGCNAVSLIVDRFLNASRVVATKVVERHDELGFAVKHYLHVRSCGAPQLDEPIMYRRSHRWIAHIEFRLEFTRSGWR
jgi:hypothetical protein